MKQNIVVESLTSAFLKFSSKQGLQLTKFATLVTFANNLKQHGYKQQMQQLVALPGESPKIIVDHSVADCCGMQHA